MAIETTATSSASTSARARPAAISAATAFLNADIGPRFSFARRSSRTFAIESSDHLIWHFIRRKNSALFGSSTMCMALRTIMSATFGNVSSPCGISSSSCRRNFASASSTSSTRSRSFDSKCQYTAPFVILSRAAMSLKVVRS